MQAKRKSPWRSFGLLVLWAGLLAAAMIARSRLSGAQLWALIALGALAGVWYMALALCDAAARAARWSAWNKRLRALVDATDAQESAHLFEAFDADEWEAIFSVLEQMPKGSRNLRRAIRTVEPDWNA